MQRRTLLHGAALASAPWWLQSSHAQNPGWPSRSIKVVVPFPPGGGTDMVARAVGQALSLQLGQPVVIDNRPGAATQIGAEAVARAPADGYTLLVSGSSTFSVNPALRPRLNYDPLKDLTSLAVLVRTPLVIVVPAASPLASMADLLKAAGEPSRRLRYATYGSGSAPHLAGLLLSMASGLSFEDIPYKGSAQVTTALLSQEIEFAYDTLFATAPLIAAGRLRALATPSPKRSPGLPDTPSLAELGLPGANFETWYAIAAPAGLAPPAQQRLVQALRAAMAEPALQNQLQLQALQPAYEDAQAMRTLMDKEIRQFRAVAAHAGIALD